MDNFFPAWPLALSGASRGAAVLGGSRGARGLRRHPLRAGGRGRRAARLARAQAAAGRRRAEVKTPPGSCHSPRQVAGDDGAERPPGPRGDDPGGCRGAVRRPPGPSGLRAPPILSSTWDGRGGTARVDFTEGRAILVRWWPAGEAPVQLGPRGPKRPGVREHGLLVDKGRSKQSIFEVPTIRLR